MGWHDILYQSLGKINFTPIFFSAFIFKCSWKSILQIHFYLSKKSTDVSKNTEDKGMMGMNYKYTCAS